MGFDLPSLMVAFTWVGFVVLVILVRRWTADS
jgi:hypothetical protein